MNIHTTKKFNKKRGVTLIEILIYCLILSIVLVVLTNLMFMLLSFFQNTQAKKAVIKNISLINNKIFRDLSKAYQVTSPNSSSFVDFLTITATDEGEINYTVSNDKLYRNNQALTEDQVIFTIDGNNLGFRLIDNTIDYRYEIEAKSEPLSGEAFRKLIKETIFLKSVL